MPCQKCGLNEATVHREAMHFRQRVKEHLCELCAGTGASIAPQAAPSASDGHRRIFIVNRHRMQAVDNEGLPLGPAKEIDPKDSPKRIPVPQGLSHLPEAVGRMLESKETNPALSIFVRGHDNPAFGSISGLAGAVWLNLMFTHHNPAGLESKVREFFSGRGLPEPRAADEVTLYWARHLSCSPLGTPAELAGLISDLLQACFAVEAPDIVEYCFIRC